MPVPTKADVLEAAKLIDENMPDDIFDKPVVLHMAIPAGCPYKFPAKTLGDLIDYLLIDRKYGGRDGSILSWNVKAYRYDVNGANMHSKRDESLDKAWEKYLDSRQGQWVHEDAFEMAQDYYRRDWSSYPGDDQGQWKFAFYGRSGGHLCLIDWDGNNFEKMDRWDYCEFLASLLDDPEKLSRFYIAIVCADNEFTPDNASENVTYQYGFRRECWEEERKEIVTKVGEAMEGAAELTCALYGVDLTEDLYANAILTIKSKCA